jgi:hypothetical protein
MFGDAPARIFPSAYCTITLLQNGHSHRVAFMASTK